MKVLVVLAHHDDEVFIMPYLRAKKIKDPSFLFISSDPQRLNESERAITFMGFENSSIHTLEVGDGKALNSLHEIFKSIHNLIMNEKIDTIITHAFEGGHPDHDSVAIVSNKLFQIGLIRHLIQLPFYHSEGLRQPFFKVMKLTIDHFQNSKTFSLTLSDSLKTIASIIYYKSQLKSFLGLFPGIFYQLVFNRKNLHYVENINLMSLNRPHEGVLLSEARFKIPWDIQREEFKRFLND